MIIYTNTLPLFLWYILLILFVTRVNFSFISKYVDKPIKINAKTKSILFTISILLLSYCFIVIDKSMFFLKHRSPAIDLTWMTSTFLIFPVAIAILCVTFVITFGNVSNLKQILGIFVFALLILFLAVNIHDIVWTLDVTYFYTYSILSNHDLLLFARISSTITGIPENTFYDYRVFGQYMILLVIAESILILRILKALKIITTKKVRCVFSGFEIKNIKQKIKEHLYKKR